MHHGTQHSVGVAITVTSQGILAANVVAVLISAMQTMVRLYEPVNLLASNGAISVGTSSCISFIADPDWKLQLLADTHEDHNA